jgi:four helix bundle protein
MSWAGVLIKTYKDLKVVRDAYQLALDVSCVSKRFPSAEQFEVAKQRRAARSTPATIVEGWAKRTSAAEFKR